MTMIHHRAADQRSNHRALRADHPDTAVGDSLAWLSAILWPDGSARLLVEQRAAGPDDATGATMRWWASPTARDPQILIPADSPRAARRAVRRYHDGFDRRRWARSMAAEAAMASPGLAGRLLADTVVVIDGPADALDRGVPGGLRALLGRDDLFFAISVARPKSNRKPVIQILDDRGLMIGWAKIGWNEWTQGLIGNEARWLSRPAWPPVIKPVVLHDTMITGHRVVITSSLAAGRRPPLRPIKPGHQPDPHVVPSIARIGSERRARVVDSRWWASVENVMTVAGAGERRMITQVMDRVAELTFSLGAWHGDFTPWNTMTVRGMAQIIDWEFAADEVPLGFDLCHFHTQVAAEMFKLSPAAALDYSARLSPQGLAALGVDPHNQIATWNLYRVELIRRTLALRRAGLDTDDVHQGRVALARTIEGTPGGDDKTGAATSTASTGHADREERRC
jgi:hypothetical protein